MSLLKIAEHIENFIKLPSYCRYLQITATPYSLFLQPDGTVQLREGEEASPWLPRFYRSCTYTQTLYWRSSIL